MQKKILFIGFVLMITSTLQLKAQYAKTDSSYKRCFVGSTLFLLGNMAPVNPPGFAQLNLGYRITGKDVISLELITWKHAWPLGINPFYNKAYGTPEEKFPGYIREYGIGLAYQRYFYKGLYAAVHVTPMWQTFKNENGDKVGNGFIIINIDVEKHKTRPQRSKLHFQTHFDVFQCILWCFLCIHKLSTKS